MQMNSIPFTLHWEIDDLLHWFENEKSLLVAIITGAGDKSFCAGSDLIEMSEGHQAQEPHKNESNKAHKHPSSGFAGISRRSGKKPIIAAVNSYALGGGWEIVPTLLPIYGPDSSRCKLYAIRLRREC
jgi:enoyl-CoA hydratase/carnithine racemase